MSGALNGLGVLITRPEHQAGPLCQRIEQHGGVTIRCPTLVIREPRNWAPALALFDRLAEYDLAIFTSANAVDRAMPPIRERGGFPPRLEIAAIGQATARALAHHGIDRCLQPKAGFTSEALLALPRFLIEGGPATAADTRAALALTEHFLARHWLRGARLEGLRARATGPRGGEDGPERGSLLVGPGEAP